MPPILITIARQYGSAGRFIGQAIAEHFHIAYYDKVVLSQAAEDTGLGPRVFHHSEPSVHDHKGFLHQVFGAVQPFIGGGDFYNSSQLSDDDIYSLQSGVITRIASEHSCVIVGRAADHILSDHPRRVSIFITADLEDRINQVMSEKNVDRKTAAKVIKQTDAQRANYYNFRSSNTWGAAETYDLCVNVSTLGRDKSTQFIIDFINAKFHLDATEESAQLASEIY